MAEMVNKHDDITKFRDEVFIFCKELQKGLIKRNFHELNSKTFEGILNEVEALPLHTLKRLNLDSVLFGSTSEIVSSKQRELQLEETVKVIPEDDRSEEKIQELLDLEKYFSKYFSPHFVKILMDKYIKKD